MSALQRQAWATSETPLFAPASFSGSSLLPAGMIMGWGGATAPIGWVLCDGASVATTVYPDLFAVIGTTYGSVGPGFYNIPNMKGRVQRGWDPSGAAPYNTRGNTGGADSVTLTANQLPAHTHPIVDTGHFHTSVVQGNGYAAADGGNGNRADAGNTGTQTTGITVGNNSTTGLAVPTTDPFIVVPYIIKTTNDHL